MERPSIGLGRSLQEAPKVFMINTGLFYAIVEVLSNPFLDFTVQAITSSLGFHNLYCRPRFFVLV